MRHRKRDIERLFAHGLPPQREARLRAHLRGCPRCRALYDEQVRLVRALSGEVDTPTPDEIERGIARVLEQVASPAHEQGAAPQKPTRRARRLPALRWTLAGAGALAATAAVLVLGPLGATPGVVGQIERATAAFVDDRPVRSGDALREAQTLRVDEDGMAVLALGPDASTRRDGGPAAATTARRVRAFPGAALRVEDGGARVRVERGKVWFDVTQHASGPQFVVVTPEAVAKVVGTSFIVERRGATTDVRVVRGTVQVTNAQGEGAIEVRARHRSRVKADGLPASPTRYSPRRDIDAWKAIMTELFEGIRDAFEAGLSQLDAILR